MLNRLWAGMVLLAAVFGLLSSIISADVAVINRMAEALLSSVKLAVDICLGLVAALVLWLGVFEIALRAGLVHQLARAIAPLLARLLPDIPPGHPAQGSISMNVAMTMLGIDDGALPAGLQAMHELESAKPEGEQGNGIASRAQQMFLVYMTASVVVFPASILGFRMQAGAAQPTDVFVPLLLAGYSGLLVGLGYMVWVQRIRPRLSALLVAGVALLALIALSIAAVRALPAGALVAGVTTLGNGALLAGVIGFVLLGWRRGVPVYDTFL